MLFGPQGIFFAAIPPVATGQKLEARLRGTAVSKST